jgi:hypothetical protein
MVAAHLEDDQRPESNRKGARIGTKERPNGDRWMRRLVGNTETELRCAQDPNHTRSPDGEGYHQKEMPSDETCMHWIWERFADIVRTQY